MSVMNCGKWAAFILAPVLFAMPAHGAVELLTNGNFEAGSLAGWSTFNQGLAGTFLLDAPGTTTPTTSFATAANPLGGGSFYAVSDSNGTGAHVLLQSFTVPSVAQELMLSFDVFYNNHVFTDFKGVGINSNTSAGPNQHAQVNLLTASATPFDTGAGQLATVAESVTITSVPQPYIHYSINLTGTVGTAPGSYQLRFAEVENLGTFNFGVDNVSLQFTPIPEPTGLAVLAIAAGLAVRR